MEFVFRVGLDADRLGIAHVVDSAFPQQRGAHKWVKESVGTPGHTWYVLEAGNRLVACAGVTEGRIRFGAGYLVRGGLGPVATLPELQGQGLATTLLRDAVRQMRGGQYDISRTGGLMRFYGRFGYVPFPRRYLEFHLPQTIRAGASNLGREYLATESKGTVRPIASDEDWQCWLELDQAFNGWRVGAPIASRGTRPQRPANGLNLVYEQDGRVLGGLLATEYGFDTEFDARIIIGRVAYDMAYPTALAALVRHVLRVAVDRDHGRVAAAIPFDPGVFAALREANLPFKVVELYESLVGSMVQVLNLRTTLEHLGPELKKRWVKACWPMEENLTLEVGDQTATLTLGSQSVRVDNEEHGVHRVSTTDGELLAMVLGYHSPRFLLGRTDSRPDPVALQILEVLFPEQPSLALNW